MNEDKMKYISEMFKDIERMALEEKWDYNIQEADELDFYIDIINIIVSNAKSDIYENSEDTIRTSKNLKYAYLFLKKINPEFGQEFIDAYHKGDIHVDLSFINKKDKYKIDETTDGRDLEESEKDGPAMSYNIDENKNFVKLPIQNTIFDSNALVHEFIHYLTINKNNYNEIGLFEETPSIASEYLFEEMYNDINGVYKVGTDNLRTIYSASVAAKIKLLLFKQIIKDNEFDFTKFLNNFSGESQTYIIKVLYNIMQSGELHVIKEFKYVIATILSFDLINNNEALSDVISILQKDPRELSLYLKLHSSPNGKSIRRDIIERFNNSYSKKVDERNQIIKTRNERSIRGL